MNKSLTYCTPPSASEESSSDDVEENSEEMLLHQPYFSIDNTGDDDSLSLLHDRQRGTETPPCSSSYGTAIAFH
jgi:hypothetical protein